MSGFPMADAPDISVLIATHNRAESLRATLDAFCRLDRTHLEFELAIIDNNSNDHTKQVTESFENQLPIHYLFEPRPGKNYALNLALEQLTLGNLVAFMDDDISPDPNCLKAILSISDRWPDVSVFGGRIDIAWPDGTIPPWAQNPCIQPFAFGLHHQPHGEGPYRRGVYPFGGLLWIRRCVFENGHRFDESIGPRPTDRIMGSESTLLRRLDDEGFQMIYGPDAVVKHRIQDELLTQRAQWRRAYRQGRGTAHWRGPAYARVYHASRLVWYLVCIVGIGVACVRAAASMLSISSIARVERTVKAIKQLGHAIESLRLAPRRIRSWTSPL